MSASRLPPHIDFTRTLLRHLVRPDMPAVADAIAKPTQRPPIARLLYAARLAATLRCAARTQAIATPMTITSIRTLDSQDRDRLPGYTEYILAGLSDIVGADLITGTAILQASSAQGAEYKRLLERYHRDMDDQIAGGKAIIALVADHTDLSEAARMLPRMEYTLSPVTGAIIAEVMRVTSRAPTRFLVGKLSLQDRHLALLPQSVLTGALSLTSPGKAVEMILSAVASHVAPPSGAGLDALHLAPDLRRHIDGLLTDLADFRAGRVTWEDVSSSILMWGPPGCGKTSIAQGLAVSARLHFVSASFSECQSAGPLSDYLKAMEKRVEEAIRRAPSLIFIDELDSYVSRGADNERNDVYMQLVVNNLLEVLSRLNRTPGVVVVAGTNFPDLVDKAITRAGRFDTHIHVGPPDRAGVEAILRKRLGPAMPDLDLTDPVQALIGLSGADISTAATKAISIARRAGRQVTCGDLMEVIADIVPASFAEQSWRIAVHEAGHAVARVSLGLSAPDRVVLSPRQSYVEGDMPSLFRLVDVHAIIAVFLAGRAAEVAVLGDSSSGAETDLRQATELALAAETRLGLTTENALYRPYSAGSPVTWPERVQYALLRHMSKAGKLAAEAVAANEASLLAIAQALLAERELTGDALGQLLAPVVPVAAPSSGSAGSLVKHPRGQTSDDREAAV